MGTHSRKPGDAPCSTNMLLIGGSPTMKCLKVELSTPAGPFFTAIASSVDLRTMDGSLHVNSGDESFLNLIHATEIICRTAGGTHVFDLTNAVAGLKGSTFTVLAERIRRVAPDADSATAPQP